MPFPKWFPLYIAYWPMYHFNNNVSQLMCNMKTVSPANMLLSGICQTNIFKLPFHILVSAKCVLHFLYPCCGYFRNSWKWEKYLSSWGRLWTASCFTHEVHQIKFIVVQVPHITHCLDWRTGRWYQQWYYSKATVYTASVTVFFCKNTKCFDQVFQLFG